MPRPDPQGQVALLLCESLLHVLVEQRVISREAALSAIESVLKLTQESAEATTRQRLPRSSTPKDCCDFRGEGLAVAGNPAIKSPGIPTLLGHSAQPDIYIALRRSANLAPIRIIFARWLETKLN
jgi:hypothetical protein